MKVDKEALMKHRFWIGLGVFALLFALLVILLPFTIGSEISSLQKKYSDAKTAVEKIKSPKTDFANPYWVDPLKQKEVILKKRKDEVWAAAWKTQEGLMTWPGDSYAPLKQLAKAYFLDPIPNPDHRRRYADTLYAKQLQDSIFEYYTFKNAIAPAYYQSGNWEAIIKPVTSWSSSPPTPDECWFAQEDLWVKRELVHVVRDAIDSSAGFKAGPAEGAAPAPATPGVQRFHNDNWELALILERNDKKQLVISAKSSIKNVNPNQRRLPLAGILLEVMQKNKNGPSRGPVHVLIEGEPLPWARTAEVKKATLVDTFTPDDPLEVKQIYNWYTCPVKRLDRIEIGDKAAQSHRTAKWTLQTKSTAPKEEAKEASDTTGAPGGSSGTGVPMMTSAPLPPGLGGQVGGPNSNAAKTDSVERNRYLEVSDQVRRMPVAMVVVVDQAHVQDVLTAVANSRLHIWITQCQWQHVHGISAPSQPQMQPSPSEGLGGEQPGEVAEGPRGMSPAMMGGKMGKGGYGQMPRSPSGAPGIGSGMPAIPGGSGMPPGFGMGTGDPAAYGVEQDDPNLVELVVYGIASLYERYPPKPPATDGAPATQPTTPATNSPATGQTVPPAADQSAGVPTPPATGPVTTPPMPPATVPPAVGQPLPPAAGQPAADRPTAPAPGQAAPPVSGQPAKP